MLLANELPPRWEPGVDWRIGGFAVIASILTALGADFFDTLALPIENGRASSRRDRGGDGPVSTVVSRSFARTAWPDREAAQRQLRLLIDDDDAPWNEGATGAGWLTVVGTAGDYRGFNESERRLEPGPAVYVPLARMPRRMMHLIVHTTGPPHAAFPAIRDVVAAIDPDQPLAFVRAYDEVVFALFGDRRVLSWLLTAVVPVRRATRIDPAAWLREE